MFQGLRAWLLVILMSVICITKLENWWRDVNWLKRSTQEWVQIYVDVLIRWVD